MIFSIIHLEDELTENRVLSGSLYSQLDEIFYTHPEMKLLDFEDGTQKVEQSFSIKFKYKNVHHKFNYLGIAYKDEFVQRLTTIGKDTTLFFVLMDWQYEKGKTIAEFLPEMRTHLDQQAWAFWTAWPGEIQASFPNIHAEGRVFPKARPVDKLSEHIVKTFVETLEKFEKKHHGN